MDQQLKETVVENVVELVETFNFELHVEQCFALLELIHSDKECLVPEGFFREITKFHTFYKSVRKILPPVEN